MTQQTSFLKKVVHEESNSLIDKAIDLIRTTVNKKLELERNKKAKLERIKQGSMDLFLIGKIRVKVM
jgi:hypothetical protein